MRSLFADRSCLNGADVVKSRPESWEISLKVSFSADGKAILSKLSKNTPRKKYICRVYARRYEREDN